MENITNVAHDECYVVEIDGKIQSQYGIFVEAVKAGLKLKQKFPDSSTRSGRLRALIDRTTCVLPASR
jgi:hypothetical protein